MFGTLLTDDKMPEEKPEVVVSAFPARCGSTLPVTRERLLAAQRADPTLVKCFEQVVSDDKARGEKVAYVLDTEILVRKWSLTATAEADWSVVHQVVVPVPYRQHVLSVAHESQW